MASNVDSVYDSGMQRVYGDCIWCWSDDMISKLLVSCPECSELLTLGEMDYEVAVDGTVDPSVTCECGFEAFVNLVGWRGWDELPTNAWIPLED